MTTQARDVPGGLQQSTILRTASGAANGRWRRPPPVEDAATDEQSGGGRIRDCTRPGEEAGITSGLSCHRHLPLHLLRLSLTHTQGKQKKVAEKNSTVCCRRSYCQVSKSNNHLLGYYKDKGVLDIGDFSSRTWYFHHCITVPTTAILSDNLATEGAVIRAHNSVGSPGIGGPKGITCVGRDGFDRTM